MSKTLTVLIIGAGTVGKALGKLIAKAGHLVQYQDKEKPFMKQTFDIIHITFPMVDYDEWIHSVEEWLELYSSKFLVVESSIIPDALDLIDHPGLVYSPIRATEAIMEKQLGKFKKYFAFYDKTISPLELDFLEYIGSVFPQGVVRFNDAKSLAFGKMLEVVDFGLQIAFAQQVCLACIENNYDFSEAYTEYRKGSLYGQDYNNLTKKGAPSDWIPRGLFRPDIIGGKCVMQDAKLLQQGNLLGSLMEYLYESNEEMKEMLE